MNNKNNKNKNQNKNKNKNKKVQNINWLEWLYISVQLNMDIILAILI